MSDALIESAPVERVYGTNKRQLSEIGEKLRMCLLLSIGYSANIGGTGVVSGTGPNMVMMGVMKQ